LKYLHGNDPKQVRQPCWRWPQGHVRPRAQDTRRTIDLANTTPGDRKSQGRLGLYLMFFYVPSPNQAYANIQTIQTEVAFGQYIRNVHRWSAHLMVLAVMAHTATVFYRGTYKSPREFN
jgi:hypothetical protein